MSKIEYMLNLDSLLIAADIQLQNGSLSRAAELYEQASCCADRRNNMERQQALRRLAGKLNWRAETERFRQRLMAEEAEQAIKAKPKKLIVRRR